MQTMKACALSATLALVVVSLSACSGMSAREKTPLSVQA